ncbi:hypothetical protein H2203_004061 [Taxawa tesnikishii (nom. ined.)]|nr:hypothetical protein H2203_004061 [Dothideales sp. JES 119]
MQTVIPPHWQDRVGQDGRMNALISLASLERANQGLAQTDWPLSALAADAQAMAQAPEMIEAQEGLAARNFSLEEYQRQLREDELSGQSALEAQTLEQMRESALQSELQHLEDIQEQGKRQEQQNRDDELAQTAADLLAKVSDNKTSKFQNSAFLGLMRKLADHQVKVEGDKMVETGSTPLSDQVPDLRPVAVDNGYRPPMLHRGSSQDNQRPPLPLHDADVDAASNTIRDGQAVVDLLNQPGAEEPPAIEDQGEHFSLNEYWIDAQEDVWASQDPSVPGRRLPVGYMEQLRNLQNRFLVPQHEEDRE